jgi:hypothetical protein
MTLDRLCQTDAKFPTRLDPNLTRGDTTRLRMTSSDFSFLLRVMLQLVHEKMTSRLLIVVDWSLHGKILSVSVLFFLECPTSSLLSPTHTFIYYRGFASSLRPTFKTAKLTPHQPLLFLPSLLEAASPSSTKEEKR